MDVNGNEGLGGFKVSRKRGRPSMREGSHDLLHVRISSWIVKDLKLLMWKDKKMYGKVSMNWYIENVLYRYVKYREVEVEEIKKLLMAGSEQVIGDTK